MIKSKLVLQTGEEFEGLSPSWIQSQNFGEIVFNTGMVGYTEVLTDPSYLGQIICFTYPMIGNYGVENKNFWESDKIKANGLIVSELAPFYARTQNEISLENWCKKNNTPIICNIDTRALTKVLRDKGVILGAILRLDNENNKPLDFINFNDINLVEKVSIKEPIIYNKNAKKTLIVVDCGIKSNILRNFLRYKDIAIKRVPFDYDYNNEEYDAIFISNGPGNPEKCIKTIEILKKSMNKYTNKPIFGICLGAQIMGLAINAKTYKLKFGHRAQNHPCLLENTNRCYLTSQNHGYSVDEKTLPNDWEILFRNLNDNTVQGIKHKTKPYLSVQFHPEAGPGPVDTAWLFDDFIKEII